MKWRNNKVKQYRKLNNQLTRGSDRPKEVYMEEIREEMMDHQKKGRYALM